MSFGAELGVDVEVHSGRTSGGSTARIAALAHRTDLLVIVTGTNSHNAVRVAKREAVKAGVPTHIATFCGAAAARALIARVAALPDGGGPRPARGKGRLELVPRAPGR